MARQPPTVTRIEAAAICGLSPRQFDEVIRPRAVGAETGRGAGLRFHLVPIVSALVEYRLEQASPAALDEDDEHDQAPDAGTPLGRKRLAEAELKELELAERRGALVRLHLISDALRPAFSAMRSTGDWLTRRFGNDAGDSFNRGVADFEAAALAALQRSSVNAPATAPPRRDHALSPGGTDAADADDPPDRAVRAR